MAHGFMIPEVELWVRPAPLIVYRSRDPASLPSTGRGLLQEAGGEESSEGSYDAISMKHGGGDSR